MLAQAPSDGTGISVQPVSPRTERPSRTFTYEKARREFDCLIARLTRAVGAGDRRQVRRISRSILASPTAHFVAVHEANARLKPHRRQPREVVREIAAALNPWRRSTDTARVRVIPKGSGKGLRAIIDFELEARAAQWLVREIILPTLRVRDDQFAFKNGGEPAAARRIVTLIESGYAYAAELDIKKAFPSFRGEGIMELLGTIPRKVSEATCLARGERYRLTNPEDLDQANALRAAAGGVASSSITSAELGVGSGLSQGALSSPLIAEAAVATVIDGAERRPGWPKSVQLVVFVDNIAVLGRSKAAVEIAVEMLGDAFERTSVGPLKVTKSKVRLTSRGFDFLGKRYTAKNIRTSVEVVFIKRSEFVRRIIALIENNTKYEDDVRRYVKGWGASASLRRGGRPLTFATQWANSVLRYALDQKLRGRALREQATFQHRVLHEPDSAYAY